MLEPIARALADWLRDHPEHGINRLLPLSQDDGDHGRLPRIAGVWDETTHDLVTEILPTEASAYPLLVLRLQDPETMDGRTVHTWEDGEYDVAIEYLNRDVSAARRKAHGYRTLRLVLLSLRRFNDPRLNPANSANRTRNGVWINTVEQFRYRPMGSELGGGYNAGAVLVRVTASDTMLND